MSGEGDLSSRMSDLQLKSSQVLEPKTKVLALYEIPSHEYYQATVDSYDPQSQRYRLTWDDQDTKGRSVASLNLCRDEAPKQVEVHVNTQVVFLQGKIWHRGEVAKKYCEKIDGVDVWKFDGFHIYGALNFKNVEYDGFAFEFKGLTLEQIRLIGSESDSYIAGTKVLALYSNCTYSYFPATVNNFNSEEKFYTIDWTDGDGRGKEVRPNNLAQDKVPAVEDLQVGSNVLFTQGKYAMDGKEYDFWHKGEITAKYSKKSDGEIVWFFDLYHRYGALDGKNVKYEGYAFEVLELTVDKLRWAP